MMERFSRIRQLCAYNHKTRSNHNEEIKSLQKDVKNLKSELYVMSNTVKSVIYLKQEGIKLQKDVTDIKEDIKILLDENRETV